MKKLFVLIAMTALLLFSCEKEPVTSSMNYIESDEIIYDTSIFILNMGIDTVIMVEPRGTNFDTVDYLPKLDSWRIAYKYDWKMIIVDKWEKIDNNDTVAYGVSQYPIDNINLLCYFDIYVEHIISINNDGRRDTVKPINYINVGSKNVKVTIIDKYEYSPSVSYYSEDPLLSNFIK